MNHATVGRGEQEKAASRWPRWLRGLRASSRVILTGSMGLFGVSVSSDPGEKMFDYPSLEPSSRSSLPVEGLPIDTLRVAAFERLDQGDPAPDPWRHLTFGDGRGETRYFGSIVDGRPCLAARAESQGSGLIRNLLGEIGSGSEGFTRIRWSWWVEGPVPGGDLSKKAGDDFSARIYVNFVFSPQGLALGARLRHRLARSRFGGDPPGRALVYVWGNQAPPGTIAPNPYTDEAMVVVVRSGGAEASEWWTEEENFVEDFERAFGEPPPALHSIALMTDGDDTGATVSACYGDIFIF